MSEADEAFDVWPECWDALLLFIESADQVIVSGMGTVIGLNVLAVDLVASKIGVAFEGDTYRLWRVAANEYRRIINQPKDPNNHSGRPI